MCKNLSKNAACNDADRLLSEEAFPVRATCMYRATHADYKARTERTRYGADG